MNTIECIGSNVNVILLLLPIDYSIWYTLYTNTAI